MGLNPKELALIQDTDFLIGKRKALKSIVFRLGEIETQLRLEIAKTSFSFPDGALVRSGKISRGENYKGLPYLVLDFPRFSFEKQLFIIRNMFWWGNYFMTLLITAECGYKLVELPEGEGWLRNLGTTPWNYDVNDGDWVSLDQQSLNQSHNFIAIGKTIDFSQFDGLVDFASASFHSMTKILSK